LSPNGSRNRFERARLARAARDEATLACLVIAAQLRPLWPHEPVRVAVEVVLPKGARRLDDDGLIALLKHTIDGTQQLVIDDDRQVRWGAVSWTRDPRARAGLVRLTFAPVRDEEEGR